ncbi:hypothetical protein NKH89_03710 [Mesorhizobium sp. M0923]|uniref:hypothetical protein n=1 Tax=Mesorhizobium sp. M0923 TaxID=2957028 RepID=UPI00333A3905
MKTGRAGLALSAPMGKIGDLDCLASDPQLTAEDSFRNAVGISIVDQSDDKAQKDARADDRRKLHVASKSVAVEMLRPCAEQRLLA